METLWRTSGAGYFILKESMFKKLLITTGIVGATILGVSVLAPRHVGPPQAYPDSKLTPGLVATTGFEELTAVSSCGTYSKCHRLSGSLFPQIWAEYPNCPHAVGQSESDHFLPLALGGSDELANRWCEPANIMVNGVDYGFHTKDKLENTMVILMKTRQISPNDAQQCILKDWVACYDKYVKGRLGGDVPALDPDDAEVYVN